MELTTARAHHAVAIVGGGCAGTLVAIHLLRRDRRPRRIVIFEPRSELGAGVAYSTDDPRHLLNAPACAMSAFDDDPSHFVAWLAGRNAAWGPTDFVPRYLYRQYMQDVLRRGCHSAPDTEVTWVHESVTSMDVSEEAGQAVTTLRYGQGRHCRVGSVVLALGAPASVALAGLDASPTFGMIGDPWCPGALETRAPSGDVLILGTGLTMVDVAIALTDRDRNCTVHARSRHGLVPTAHTSDGYAPWPGFAIGSPTSARDVVHRLREMVVEAESDGWNWRNVIAAARTAAPAVWGGLAESERRRVLRHVGRRWDVSRHRMAPPVAAAVDHLQRCGRLTVGPGRVLAVHNKGSLGEPRLRVTLARPGAHHETLTVHALIDCTGPGPDPTVGSPLVAGLVAQGLARVHPTGMGLDVDEHGDLRLRSGASGSIHSVGWCRRGAEFEATAVPEIRRQAERLSRQMAATVDCRVPDLVAS